MINHASAPNRTDNPSEPTLALWFGTDYSPLDEIVLL
jgi:hypothetical protein